MFLEWLKGQEQYADKNVLITTHGAALSGMLNYIKGKPLSDYWGWGVHKNCAVTEVEALDGKFQVISENQVYYDDVVKPW